MVVMQHPKPEAAFLQQHVDARIINAGDGAHEHPTQALLDTYSIREKFGTLRDKKVVIGGDILLMCCFVYIFALQLLVPKLWFVGQNRLFLNTFTNWVLLSKRI